MIFLSFISGHNPVHAIFVLLCVQESLSCWNVILSRNVSFDLTSGCLS